MTAKSVALFLSPLLAAALPLARAQEPASGVEQKLREQVRSFQLQLRTAEGERAALQAAQTERDQKIKTLTAQIEALTKQSAEDREGAEKAMLKLNEELAAKSTDIVRINELLVKSEAAGKKSAELAKVKEEQRAKLAAQGIQLQRTVTDQRAKNAKMFEVATEILSRYEKFGLGTALTAREPFVGITRARLQSLVDEYDSKISEQRIKP